MTRIRPLEAQDQAAMTDLMLAFYPGLRADRAFAETYYHWKYYDLTGRHTGYPAALVAEDSAGLAGIIGSLPFVLQFEEEMVPAAWIVDWRITDRARGQGLGQQLLSALIETVPAVACVDGSERAKQLYRKFEFQEWDSARKWQRVCQPMPYYWQRSASIRKLLTPYYALRSPKFTVPASTEIKLGGAVSLTDDEVSLCLPPARNGLRRDAGYYRWLARCPGAHLALHRLQLERDEKGHVLFNLAEDRYGLRYARVLDLHLTDDTKLNSAWLAVCQHLETEGVVYIDTIADQRHERALQQSFVGHNRKTFWLKSAALKIPAYSDPAWVISPVDKDDAFRGSYVIP